MFRLAPQHGHPVMSLSVSPVYCVAVQQAEWARALKEGSERLRREGQAERYVKQ